jgi:hypothetical protein
LKHKSETIPAVPVDLLIRANEVVTKDHGKGDVTVSIVVALADTHGPEELLAVSYRLRALAKLVGSKVADQWTMTVAGKSYTLVNEALFRAAATTSLKTRAMVADIAFDPEEFLLNALAESESAGSG